MTISLFCSLLAMIWESDAWRANGSEGMWMLLFFTGLLGSVGVAVALIWRRSSPFLVTCLTAGAAIILPLDSFATLLALTWAIGSETRRRALIAAAAATIATIVAIAKDARRDAEFQVFTMKDSQTGEITSTFPVIGLVIIGILSIGTAIGIGFIRRYRNQSAASVEAQLTSHAVMEDRGTRQAEREQIAREIHDSLGQRIADISLGASALQMTSDDERTQQASQRIRQASQQMVSDLQALLTTLRAGDPYSSNSATVNDLIALITEQQNRGQAFSSSIFLSNAEQASPQLLRAICRILQESFTNAMKHAPGQPVAVIIRGGPTSGVDLSVRNPLPLGQPPGLGTSSGLIGMEERAHELGGEFHAGHYVDDAGQPMWEVSAHLPWMSA
jgi:signal transduction histidine kinase